MKIYQHTHHWFAEFNKEFAKEADPSINLEEHPCFLRYKYYVKEYRKQHTHKTYHLLLSPIHKFTLETQSMVLREGKTIQ